MHRATWDPARGQNNQAHLSRTVANQQLPAHKVLKTRQPEQGGVIPTLANRTGGRRDLKKELERAERAVRNKKRAEKGLPPEPEPEEEEEKAAAQEKGEEAKRIAGEEEEQAAKRRRLIEEAVALDADDDDSDEEEEDKGDSAARSADKGKEKARCVELEPRCSAACRTSADPSDLLPRSTETTS